PALVPPPRLAPLSGPSPHPPRTLLLPPPAPAPPAPARPAPLPPRLAPAPLIAGPPAPPPSGCPAPPRARRAASAGGRAGPPRRPSRRRSGHGGPPGDAAVRRTGRAPRLPGGVRRRRRGPLSARQAGVRPPGRPLRPAGRGVQRHAVPRPAVAPRTDTVPGQP